MDFKKSFKNSNAIPVSNIAPINANRNIVLTGETMTVESSPH